MKKQQTEIECHKSDVANEMTQANTIQNYMSVCVSELFFIWTFKDATIKQISYRFN